MSAAQASDPGDARGAIDPSEAPLWLGLMALLVASHGSATLLPNESVYLLGPLRVTDPTILAHDWSVAGPPLDDLAVVFRLVVAPLYLVTDDARVVAWVMRPLLWLWVLAGFRVLASAMDVTARGWAAGLALYICGSSGLTAGEWIFGGAEQKVLAYGAVLFGVAAMTRGRTVAAGGWIGLATATHVLVGGWSAAALAVASLVDVRRLGLRRLLLAGCLAAAIAAPVLWIGFGFLRAGGDAAVSVPPDAAGAAAMTASEFMARIRIPHHVDPAHFLDARTIVELPLVFGFALWLLARAAPAQGRRLLVCFLATLGLFFCLGLMARAAGIYWFLVLYPFRVADALVPAFFWLCVPPAFADWRRSRARDASPEVDRLLAAAMIVALLFFAVEARQLVKRVRTTAASWLPAERAERARELEIMWAIRDALPEDAVIAAAPCEQDVWIFGRRAVVAAYKTAPANHRILEWRDRVRALQGDAPLMPFTREVCRESTTRFAMLPLGAYVSLRDRYGATHALIDAVRDDLVGYEVLRAGGRSVIALDRIGAAAPGADETGAREAPVGQTMVEP